MSLYPLHSTTLRASRRSSFNETDTMLVVMNHTATTPEVDRVIHTIREMGYEARPIPVKQHTVVLIAGPCSVESREQ